MDRYNAKNGMSKYDTGNQCDFETFYFDDSQEEVVQEP